MKTTIVRNFTSLRTARAFVAAATTSNPGATYRMRGPHSDGGYTVARNPTVAA